MGHLGQSIKQQQVKMSYFKILVLLLCTTAVPASPRGRVSHHHHHHHYHQHHHHHNHHKAKAGLRPARPTRIVGPRNR